MFVPLNNGWLPFCVLFGLMLLLTFIMNLQGKQFYTKDVVIRKFTIFDLQLAANPKEMANIIRGIYELQQSQSKKTLNALKGQLYVDFLWMPCAYGSVCLLCMRVAERMSFSLGYNVFMGLGWLQMAAWICDILENIYLLGKIHPDAFIQNLSLHKTYLRMEAVKWGLVLTGAVFAVSAICYFWLSGHYSFKSLPFVFIVLGEILLFLTAQMFFVKEKIVG